jgi:hypothetical protein
MRRKQTEPAHQQPTDQQPPTSFSEEFKPTQVSEFDPPNNTSADKTIHPDEEFDDDGK